MGYRKLTLFLLTLTIAVTAVGQPTLEKPKRKVAFGVFAGVGAAKFSFSKNNWIQPSVNYNDSLNNIKSVSNLSVSLGLTCQINITEKLSIRPAAKVILGETGNLIYERKTTNEVINFNAAAESIAIPFIYRFGNGKLHPYIKAGPEVLYNLGQTDETESKIQLSRFDFLGQFGIGVEILTKSIMVAPELSFSTGFFKANSNNNNNLYTETISTLHRQYISLSFYFSDKH